MRDEVSPHIFIVDRKGVAELQMTFMKHPLVHFLKAFYDHYSMFMVEVALFMNFQVLQNE